MIDAVLPSMEKAMQDVGIQGDFWRNMLSRSKEASQGDLALPCFPFAKQLGCAPNEAAQKIADALELEIGEAVAVGPYVNIRASITWLAKQIHQEPESKGSILIEHTSANPNGLPCGSCEECGVGRYLRANAQSCWIRRDCRILCR